MQSIYERPGGAAHAQYHPGRAGQLDTAGPQDRTRSMQRTQVCLWLGAAVLLQAGAVPFLDEMVRQPVQLYRRAVYDNQYGTTGYSTQRPVILQWFPWIQQGGITPTTYDASAYSNPLVNFLQSPWFPWSNNRQPTAPTATQGVWSPANLLPWSGQQTAQGPVVSFFQNPSGALFPWNRPGVGSASGTVATSGVVYETPLTPTAPASTAQQVIGSGSSSAEPPKAMAIPTSSSVNLLNAQKLTDDSNAAMIVEDTVVHQMPIGVRGISLSQALSQGLLPSSLNAGYFSTS